MKTISPRGGLAADPAVRWRDALLDPDHVAEQVTRLWHRELAVESCTVRRVNYRFGETLSVVYDIVADDQPYVMSARTFSDSAAAFQEATHVTPVRGMPGIAHDPETSSVWWIVPNDPRLRNLGTLLAAPQRVREVSGVQWQHSTLVAYAPEQSATVRIRDISGQVSGYAKVYQRRDPFEVAGYHNRVAALVALVDGLRMPRALGWARPDRIVVLEAMPGIPWSQLPGHAQPLAVHRLGSALAQVHSLPSDLIKAPFQRLGRDRVGDRADLVAVARPDVAEIVDRLRDRLTAGPPLPPESVFLHGDVPGDNVLFHGDEVHMIDFDHGGSGAASADIGSMLAALTTRQLVGRHSTVEGLAATFIDGYREIRPMPSIAELSWYTGAALVAEQAIGAVNAVDDAALDALPQILETAEATLAGRVGVAG